MAKVMKAITGLIGKILPKAPKIDIPVMPDPGSTASMLAMSRKMNERKGRGREGTIYSGAGGAYGGLNLGGTS